MRKNWNLGLLILTILFSSQFATARPLSSQEILAKHQAAKQSLKDLQTKAKLKLDVVAGFIPYSERLTGRYFFKQKNKHRLQFDDAPSYLRKAPSMFRWELPSLEKYVPKVKGPFADGERKYYEILYLRKDSGSKTASVACRFDSTNWRVYQQQTNYRDGGYVKLNFEYLAKSALPVLDRVKAKVSIPAYSIKGRATIDFSNHKVNRGVSDSVFRS